MSKKIISGLLIISAIILLLTACDNSNNLQDNQDISNSDTSVGEVQEEKTTTGAELSDYEIKNKLDQAMINSFVTVSINANPVFDNGRAEGNLDILNSSSNLYPQIVEIYTSDLPDLAENESKLIYKSKAINIGERINTDSLEVKLQKGVYDCIAYFNSIDPETNLVVSRASVEMQITINN